MTEYQFLSGKKGRVLFGFCLFVLLLFSRDTLYTSTVLGFGPSQLIMYSVVGLLGIGFLTVNRKNWKSIVTDPRLLTAIPITAIMVLPMVIKADWQTMYISILLCMYIAIFFSFFRSSREVARCYVVILTCLAAYSLLAEYVLDPMVSAGWFSAPVIPYNESRTFRGYLLSFVVKRKGYLRNYGIFREPGIYQFFLILGLYWNNYRLNWEKKWQFWTVNGILAATMVSTFSTGGVIELALMAAVLFFEKKLYRDKRIVAALIACGVLGVAVVVYSIVRHNALYGALSTMVKKLFVINDSSGSRYEAIATDLRIFLENPLFGANFAETLYAVKHNTSSTLLLYAVYGILGGTLNVAGWVAMVWDRERSVLLNGMLVLIMLMAINTQNFTVNVFFWLFPTMALVERAGQLLEKRRK